MRRIINYCLLFTLLITATGVAFAGPDYEKMLAHSAKRWASNLALLRKDNVKPDVAIVYLCRENKEAEKLVREFLKPNSGIEQGKWLGYTVKVLVRAAIPISKEDSESWIRRQFFLGVAYNCDMDGLQRVGENGL